jgi:predicted CXXCH cytochrome family protein
VKKHVWRPLWVVIGLVAVILLARALYVPTDFGAQERGYTFGFHRLGNEQEWQRLPARYQGNGYCVDCHEEQVGRLAAGRHRGFPCENCHTAAGEHPDKPEKLAVDRSRALCLRCHAQLYMPSSGRNSIPGINPEFHNGTTECVACHNPHKPNLEDM